MSERAFAGGDLWIRIWSGGSLKLSDLKLRVISDLANTVRISLVILESHSPASHMRIYIYCESAIGHGPNVSRLPVYVHRIRVRTRARDCRRVNVFSNFYLSQAVVKHYRDNEGCTIVFNTSINAAVGNPHLISYTASKGAQQSLMRSLAKNLVSRGIRVNAVAPGPIWTPFIGEFTRTIM